jgi:ubiquinone/menaquinone biosynthesis C-methylase UbiE
MLLRPCWLPDDAVDRVIMINTFSQFPRPELVIAETARVLRKGGRLDIKYFFSREEISLHHGSKAPLKELSIPDNPLLYSWFNTAGFISTAADREDGFHFTSRLVGYKR